MLIRFIGVCLLSLTGICLAAALSGYEHRRVSVLDGYISLLRYVRGQIDGLAMPMDVILSEADPALLAACRGYGRRGGPLPPDAVRPVPDLACLVRESRSYLGPETERLLQEFSGGLGRAFRRDEVSRCDRCLLALDEQRGRLADTLPARVRTGGALCLTLFLTAALLLW